MQIGTVTIHTDTGGFTPPTNPTPAENEASAPPLPRGRYRPPKRPSHPVPGLAATTSAASAAGRAHAAGAGVTVATAKRLATGSNGIVQEPSVASSGSVVMYTFNWGAAYSVDGGQTFTQIDPNTIFPKVPNPHAGDSGGYCCDQVVIYDPSTDRFIWALQYPTDSNGVDFMRVAYTSPATLAASGGMKWSYFDLRSDAVVPAGFILDQPRLGLTPRYLYMNVNQADSGGVHRTVIVRWPRAQFATGGPTGYGWAVVDPWSLRVASRVTASYEVFVGHNTRSQLAVASVPDDSNNVYLQYLDEPSIADENWKITTPGGDDMLGRQACSQGSQVTGVTQDNGFKVWVAWSQGRDILKSGNGSSCNGGGNVTHFLPQPHIAVAVLAPHAIVGGQPIFRLEDNSPTYYYNPNFAIAMPDLTTTDSGDVAIDVLWGGGSSYANHAVGFLSGGFDWVNDGTAHADPPQKGNPAGEYDTVHADAPPYGDCVMAAGDVNDLRPPPTLRAVPNLPVVSPSQQPQIGYPVFSIFSRPGVTCPTSFQPPPPPKGPPPPPPPQSETMTLRCPASVNAGQTFTVTGSLSPALAGAPITLTYFSSAPGQPAVTHNGVTDSSGSFSDSAPAEPAGTVIVDAAYFGDATHVSARQTCAVTVQQVIG